MARKPKDDTPAGGWQTPAVDGKCDPRPPEQYAHGVKTVRGRLEWRWKPVDAKYLAQQQAARVQPEPPAVRVRVRERKR